jgi:serine/threonine protein kinase
MADGHVWTELSEGDEFAGYRIERSLGRGGMGILYLAVEPGLERRVALKLIAPEAAADDVFARRFAEESRIAASIEHPNVVPIYAAGEQEGIPYIAMRFVSGSDLGRRVAREGRLDPATAVALIAQIGNGLDAIHAAGLIHRDVKPANVLLSGGEGSEHAYITDFGVARNVATQSGLTQTGRFVGTLDYVAPEQISGGQIDARVDVYALGCLLYKLLVGEVPFPREAEAARLYAHLNDPPPAPSLHEPSLPMALDDVVIRAMSKQPGDRYPSAGDLGRAAIAALSGAPVPIPERTVATGAATVESATPPLEPPTVTSAAAKRSTRETERIEASQSGGDGDDKGSDPGRRRLAWLAGVTAVVAAIVVVILLASSGGGGGSGTTADTSGTTPAQEKAAEQHEAEAAAKQKATEEREAALTEPQLISQADAICVESQQSYAESKAESPNGEHETNVPFAKELLANSTRAVKEFNELDPPPALATKYTKYVRSQEEVKALDAKALEAAKQGDLTAYETARSERDEGNEDRHQLAHAVGLEVCSPG